MDDIQLRKLLKELINQKENECLEFKHNFHSEEEIGKDISALANGAGYHNQDYAYLLFGVKDSTNEVIGTNFDVKSYKVGNEELTFWLTKPLQPKIEFEVFEFGYDGKHISLYKIPACKNEPIRFNNISYIRIGSNTTKLNEHPTIERKIWSKETIPFEKEISKSDLTSEDVINLLSIETYYSLMKLPISTNINATIKKFEDESFIIKTGSTYSITKLGAILLAKDITSFDGLGRRIVRIIKYKGTGKTNTERELTGSQGYAVEFTKILDWINTQLPANEEIGEALRKETTMYPKTAIRELVANAIIHQDFSEKGFIMVEIFDNRVEITNPGTPLVDPNRFIDGYQSRNERLADVMRRMGFCEEKGSGFDKVIQDNEQYLLPPINIRTDDNKTKVTIYGYKQLGQLDRQERIMACYQHACLKYVSDEKMSNQSLRIRFKIEDHNTAIASRIIKDTLSAGLIKTNMENGTSTSQKFASYLPIWA